MSNLKDNLKRSSSLLNDENDEHLYHESTQVQRKKSRVLKDSNSLGVLSPPTTPENAYKKVILPNVAIKSAAKDLKAMISNNENFEMSPYTKAKNLFLRSANPFVFNRHELPGREKEAAIIEVYLKDCLQTLNSSSVYVSGPPGTGKSAQINASIKKLTDSGKLLNEKSSIYLINDSGVDKKVRIVKFNCMSLSNPNELFKQIYSQITGKSYDQNKNSSQLLKHFIKRKNTDCDLTILVLDELDNIIHKSQQLLFELFTWTSEIYEAEQKPSLLLIGIANALNLTDRFLPRLRANCISPKLVSFLPYTADQIKSVITNKLLSLISMKTEESTQQLTKLPPLVHPAAIQFCAKKAAATSGDLRRAFDIMFKSIDLFEQTINFKSFQNLQMTPLVDLPKVMISQVVKVCSECFNANFELKLKPLNLQQNMILAFIFKFEEKIEVECTQNAKFRNSKPKEMTLTSFFNYYVEKCKTFEHLNSLKRSEFLEVITSLDINGLVVLSQVNSNSNSKASLTSSTSAMINFDSYKATSNIPKSEFFKHINDISILKRVAYSSY